MPFPIGAAIGAGATALAAGLGAWGANKAVKEQAKQRKLQEKLAKQQGLRQIGGGGGALTGYEPGVTQIPRFSPEQQAAMKQLLASGLADLNPEAAQREATKQFYSETVPTLAERFTSLGSGGQGSSDFRGAIGAAGTDLAERLQAIRHNTALARLGFGLQPQTENLYNPGTAGLLQSAGASLAPVGAELFGNLASWSGKSLYDYFTQDKPVTNQLPGGQQQQPSPYQSNVLGGGNLIKATQQILPEYQGVPGLGFGSQSTLDALKKRAGRI